MAIFFFNLLSSLQSLPNPCSQIITEESDLMTMLNLDIRHFESLVQRKFPISVPSQETNQFEEITQTVRINLWKRLQKKKIEHISIFIQPSIEDERANRLHKPMQKNKILREGHTKTTFPIQLKDKPRDGTDKMGSLLRHTLKREGMRAKQNRVFRPFDNIWLHSVEHGTRLREITQLQTLFSLLGETLRLGALLSFVQSKSNIGRKHGTFVNNNASTIYNILYCWYLIGQVVEKVTNSSEIRHLSFENRKLCSSI